MPIEEFQLSLQGADLVIEGVDKDVSPLQKRFAELMLEVYNQTGKIGHFIRTHPKIRLRLESKIQRELARFGKIKIEDENLDGERSDSELIAHFFQTRKLELKDRNDPRKSRKVVMPLIDYANHNTASPGFIRTETSEGIDALGLLHSTSIEGSKECTVSYGDLDLFDTFWNYGFLDDYSPASFVRAAPCELLLKGFDNVAVNSIPGAVYKGTLAKRNVDLKKWVPSFGRNDEGVMRVGHLKIPCNHSWRALRRVLRMILRNMNPEMKMDRVQARVLVAEHQVISSTVEHFRGLRSAATNPVCSDTDHQALSELVALCDLQLERLDRYQNHHELNVL
ncbi:MAG: hypothetical protein JJ921_10585 [Pseudomonadales bacterium]|nr:hypothetical protein [Pseudomonadales bacterium]